MSGQKKIMIVDDDAGIRNLMFEVLSEEGFMVTLAENGEDSVDKMKNGRFDLIVTDLNMPRMDGVELLRDMKKKRRKEKIIVMTGESFSAASFGKDIPRIETVLKKPFRMSGFIETVEAVLHSGKRIRKTSKSKERRRKAVNVA